MIERLAILGATGDLAMRDLLPALARPDAAGALPAGFRVTAIGREEMSSHDATSVRKTHFGESAHGRLDERQHVRRVRFVLLGPEAVETHRRALEQLGSTAGGQTQ